jgi:hypothetical protein
LVSDRDPIVILAMTEAGARAGSIWVCPAETSQHASKRFEIFFGRLADQQGRDGAGETQHQDAGSRYGD